MNELEKESAPCGTKFEKEACSFFLLPVIHCCSKKVLVSLLKIIPAYRHFYMTFFTQTSFRAILCTAGFLGIQSVVSQINLENPELKWKNKDPFAQKVFIENKGQFTLGPDADGTVNKPLYAILENGLEIYFTRDGIVYRHIEFDKPVEEEGREEDAEEREEERRALTHVFTCRMQWLNSSPDVKVVAEEKVSFPYTWPPLSNATGGQGFATAAFRKISYKNLYPGIDVDYFFPAGKGGFKYTIKAKAGADLSLIKMSYPGTALNLDEQGDLLIHSSFGEITDHAPSSFYAEGNEVIESSYKINNSIVSFNLQDANAGRDIVIDPWVTYPQLAGTDVAYDVDFDLQGNVYIYGGSSVFQEIKYDSSGATQWVYNATGFSGYYYGDFTVDATSGSSYLTSGVDFSSYCMAKLNSSGIQVASMAPVSTLHELWRIVYNNCTKKLIIGAGGWSFANQGALVDTNLSVLTPVNVLNASNDYHDIALLAIDNANNCYMATSRGNPGFDNVLIRCPANTLTPPQFTAQNNNMFLEQNSFLFVNGRCNGYNGIVVTGNYVYTYNGAILEKWNKITGALVGSINVSTPQYSNYFGQHILCSWAGLTADACGNIYVGNKARVLVYDTNFTQMSTLIIGDTVLDLKVGAGNLLYACGRNFVATYQLNGSTCGPTTLAVTSNACSPAGTATVTVNGVVNTSNYSYEWEPSGNTSPIATGLSQGIHTVTITDASCLPMLAPTSATVAINYFPVPLIVASDTVCSGASLSLIGSGAGNFLWSTGETSPTISVSPTATTTYFLMVTNSFGCSDTTAHTVHVNPVPEALAWGTDTICKGHTAELFAAGGSAYLWSSGSTDQNIIVQPLATSTYSVIVSNGECTDTAYKKVIVINSPVAGASVLQTFAETAQLCASGTGSYHWFPEEGLSCINCIRPVASVKETSTYCVAVTGLNGCADTACVTILLSAVYVPDAFTPNGDILNEAFRPSVQEVHEYRLVIYDKWGEKIFETENIDEGWNGCYKGNACQQDVYVYKLTYVDDEYNRTHEQIGKVTLIR
jgi:gliding motility-associated-like protein